MNKLTAAVMNADFNESGVAVNIDAILLDILSLGVIGDFIEIFDNGRSVVNKIRQA